MGRRGRKLLLALALLACGVGMTSARAAETLALNERLQRIYLTAYDTALNRHAFRESDGTTYVSTGDIQAEWLRDASATMEPYIPDAADDERVAEDLRGVLQREAKYILIDPYANAFTADYGVVEEKFEVDSLLYPMWFAEHYFRATGDRSIFTPVVQRAFERVLAVLRTEQRHEQRSHYRNPDLAGGGRGSPVTYTGMIWTGFRPSDDPARYQYNIPDNMFAVVVLRGLTRIERDVYHDPADAESAWGLSIQVQAGVEQYGTITVKGIGKMYAYEVDGLGHYNLMDDANIPSLLSIPYIGYEDAHDPLYTSTRKFVLSSRNPYYYSGTFASGEGSPHTPQGYVWPLALIMQALTSTNPAEVRRVEGYIAASDTGDHLLHESFDANHPKEFTREDFAWPNALYADLEQRGYR
ncbi:MAG: glycoside hydrolase family 125 protein [Vulcanimicrobiaceae bacterium]